jgi:polysaccharide export outer membrane protein
MAKVGKGLGVIALLATLMLVSAASAQGPSRGSGADDTYVIGPEDKLEIHIWKETDLTREVLVRGDGKISLPLIDDVRAAGLTPPELKKVIAEKLKEFVGEPQVSVIIKEPRKFKVYVLGNVTKPGTYESSTELTYLQAIAMAGGLNEWASSKTVLITRDGDKQRRRVIHYKDVVSGDTLADNVILRSGDTIVVP